MKIAYLVLAHTDPPQLRRLVNALNGEHAFFFIHIDKRVNIGEFIPGVNQERNVQFIAHRTEVNHGGFSIVRAILALMRQALSNGTNFDYLVLLSGLDYPIKGNQFILEYFDKYRGREFIRYISILEVPFLEYKVRTMCFRDHRIMDLLTRALWKATRTRLGRRYLDGFVPYFGPTSWALTAECGEYVLRFVDEHRSFASFYRFTEAPDEMFFHTIILNSDFATKTNHRFEYARWSSRDRPVKEAGDTIKYIDWSLDRERPAILDERDFGALEKSECLFARKLTTARSLRLIERIDRYLLKR